MNGHQKGVHEILFSYWLDCGKGETATNFAIFTLAWRNIQALMWAACQWVLIHGTSDLHAFQKKWPNARRTGKVGSGSTLFPRHSLTIMHELLQVWVVVSATWKSSRAASSRFSPQDCDGSLEAALRGSGCLPERNKLFGTLTLIKSGKF